MSNDETLPFAALENGTSMSSPPVANPAKYAQFESLDYELCDNTVHKADESLKGPADPLIYKAIKYGICCMLGVIIALVAFGVNFGVENIAGTKFWLTFQTARYSYFAAWLAFVSIQTLLAVFAACCCLYIAPAAAGSGIPEVKAYLNGVDVPAVLLFRTLGAKILGSVGSVGGGLAVGKEGPFVHIGAAVASVLSQGGTWEQHSKLRWLKRFKNDRERRDFVTCGASAGVAAAFRAPVGGVLFGMEELASHWSQHLLLTCFFTTAVVNVTVRFIGSICSKGNCGFFGEGNVIIFHIMDAQDTFEVYELAPMLLVAIVGGFLGSGFNLLNAKLTAWRKRHVWCHGSRAQLLEVMAVAVFSGTVAFTLPLFFACKPCPPDTDECPSSVSTESGNYIAFGCAREGEYNDLATLFFNTQDDAIRNLFSAGTPNEYSWQSLLVFFLSFWGLTIVTYGIPVPAGLFVPGILVGASYGRLIGVFVRHLHPDSVVDEGTYALLGSASYMAGSMRIVVSVCVMLLELTNQLTLLPLMMLVLVLAKAVGDGSGVGGIYEIQTRLKSFPFLFSKAPSQLKHLTASDLVQHEGAPVTLRRVERVSRIVDVLQSCKHNGFPVLDVDDELPFEPAHRAAARPVLDASASGAGTSGAGAGPSHGATAASPSRGVAPRTQLRGLVLRHHLLVLLRSGRAMQHTPDVTHNSQRIAFMYDMTDFDKPVSTKSPTIDDIAPTLSAQAMAMYIDVGPYVNPPSYTVQASTNARQVHNLFTSLRLRHLAVVPDTPAVYGIVTRKDLMEQHAQSVIHSKLWVNADDTPEVTPIQEKRDTRATAQGPLQMELSARPGLVRPWRASKAAESSKRH